MNNDQTLSPPRLLRWKDLLLAEIHAKDIFQHVESHDEHSNGTEKRNHGESDRSSNITQQCRFEQCIFTVTTIKTAIQTFASTRVDERTTNSAVLTGDIHAEGDVPFTMFSFPIDCAFATVLPIGQGDASA